MNIVESLVRLRDDLKLWVTNNLQLLDRRTQNIEDNGSASLHVIDEKGNQILRVDKNGVKTTEIEAARISSREDTSLTVQDKDGYTILKVDETGLDTTEVKTQRLFVDGKEVGDLAFSGDYNDLTNTPAINDDGSGSLTVQDGAGNVIFCVNQAGVTTTKVTADGLDLGASVKKLIEQEPPVSDYNELENAPDITDDGSGELVVADKDGNVVMRVNDNGVEATRVIADGVDLNEAVSGLKNLVGATPVSEQIKEAVKNLSGFEGDYDDLEGAPEILEDGSAELTVTDAKGTPIMRVDEFGLETTRVIAGGVDLGAAVANLGPSFTTDETLVLADGILKVNMATEVGDQTLPVSAASVNTTVGNIEILLSTI